MRGLVLIAGAAMLFAACGGDGESKGTTPLPMTVTITSVTGDQESLFFQEAYAQALENPDGMNLRVARVDPVATQLDAFNLLMSNQIQLLPMYTGDLLKLLQEHPPAGPAQAGGVTSPPPVDSTAVTTGNTTGVTTTSGTTTSSTETSSTETSSTTPPPPPIPGSVADQIAQIRKLLPDGLTLGAAGTGEHKQMIACTGDAVQANAITNLSTLARSASKLTLGAPAGFDTATPIGAATLKAAYGITFKAVVPITDGASITAAVTGKTADCFVVDSGEQVVPEQNLQLITDDKWMVPGQAVVPVANISLGDFPLLVIDQVTDRMTKTNLSTMLALMAKGLSPREAASAFLQNASPDPDPQPLGTVIPTGSTPDSTPITGDTSAATTPTTTP